MHWSLEKAKQLIEENPNTEEFVCASGISPSGHIHIGNFREIITTYFVVKALRKLGKKARFIFSWDDYDRFRKVPKNVDSSYERYLGLPYSEIPDPHGCCESYARHFQKEFEAAIKAFDIDVEFIYQNQMYRSGKYNSELRHALLKRREIYDILMEFKTQDHCNEERENFYPMAIYCHECGKDNTSINGYNEETNEINYTCTCGFEESMSIENADNMKLNWKIDWPMRWRYENVIFEPGGRDHSSVGGSFEVSSKIAREIFDFEPPSYIAYEFIGIKGTKGKMSSSLGNLITPSQLLDVYTPEIILYIFSKYNPSAGFNFGFDDEVIRNYTEFERFRAKYLRGDLEETDVMHTSLEFSDLRRNIDEYPSYSKIAGLLPILNFDIDALRDVLVKNNERFSEEGLVELSNKIEYWINNWCSERAISVRNERAEEILNKISDEEKSWITDLMQVIERCEELSSDDLMSEIYGVTRVEDLKQTKSNQKRFFKLLYNLLINQDRGPRLSLLIKIVGSKRAKELLEI